MMDVTPEVKNLRRIPRLSAPPLFLRLRCPHCAKAFRIDTRDVKSSEPHFECLVCRSTFGFEYPTPTPLNVPTKLLRRSRVPLTGTSGKSMDVRACPKCNALNAKGESECRICGVLFDRLKDLPLDSSLGARPSLVQCWKQVLQNYESVEGHLRFLHLCLETDALPFAIKKYQDLVSAQPQDSLAQEMLDRARVIQLKPEPAQMPVRVCFELQRQLGVLRFWKTAPWALSLLLILSGALKENGEASMAFGVALLLVSMGWQLSTKGKITLGEP